jgi:hypothetical protein
MHFMSSLADFHAAIRPISAAMQLIAMQTPVAGARMAFTTLEFLHIHNIF